MDGNPFTCVICKKLVSLETTRIDEHGQPVHEECYAFRIRQETPPSEEVREDAKL
jgi:hypothetical protein